MNEQDILNGLISADPNIRLRTIRALRELGTDKAVDFLIQLLGNENTEFKQSVISTILEIGKSAVPYLVHGLRLPNPVIRSNIVKILSERSDSSNSIDLINLLKNEDGSIRAAAIEILGSIKDPWSLGYVRQFLTDPEANVRANAAQALGNFQDEPSIDALQSLLTDKETSVRIAAIEALAKLGEPRIWENLWTVSSSDEALAVRNAATSALKKIGDIIIKPYAASFASLDIEQRSKAFHDLTKYGKYVILPLLNLTRHYNASVRELSVEILGNIGDIAATQRLIELTRDYDPSVRIGSIVALGKIKSEQTLRFLVSCLNHPDSVITSTTSQVLAQLGKDVIKYLPALIKATDLHTQIQITRIIGKIGDPDIISSLAEHLNDNRMWVRRVVCFALGEIKHPVAGNLLIERCLFDRDTLVRTAAAQAIGKLKMSVLIEPLLTALEDDEETVRIEVIKALTEIGDTNVGTHLIRFLSSQSDMEKITAIHALEKLNYIGAIPQLKKMARSWPFGKEPEEVRIAAKKVLKQLEEEARYSRP